MIPVRITKAMILHVIVVLILTPLSGVIAGLLAKTVLPHYSSTQILIAMSGGAVWALGLGLHYLVNNAWFEKHVEPYVDVVDGVAKPADQLAPAAKQRLLAAGDVGELAPPGAPSDADPRLREEDAEQHAWEREQEQTARIDGPVESGPTPRANERPAAATPASAEVPPPPQPPAA